MNCSQYPFPISPADNLMSVQTNKTPQRVGHCPHRTCHKNPTTPSMPHSHLSQSVNDPTIRMGCAQFVTPLESPTNLLCSQKNKAPPNCHLPTSCRLHTSMNRDNTQACKRPLWGTLQQTQDESSNHHEQQGPQDPQDAPAVTTFTQKRPWGPPNITTIRLQSRPQTPSR